MTDMTINIQLFGAGEQVLGTEGVINTENGQVKAYGEGDGLSGDTIADCDHVVRIPMREAVDSLNVAAASAVAFWELRAR